MRRSGIFLSALFSAGLLLLDPTFRAAWAQDGGEESRAAREPSAAEVQAIVSRAGEMLRVIRPSSKGERVSWKVMQEAGGTVRWGNLFRAGHAAALVNVKQAGQEDDFNPLRKDLCYFTWQEGRWEFRQFLGRADDLEIHFRADSPSVFLQGSFRTGRYEGEFVSWYLEEPTGRLVSTGFGDWGPFSLKGDFLVRERGFERLAHDATFWIHPYKAGRMGALRARFHENDEGAFDVTFPDAVTGRWTSWIFRPDREDESRMTVTVAEDKGEGAGGEPEPESGGPEKKAEIRGAVNSRQVFEWLTGLDPMLLEGGWQDELAVRPLPRLDPLEVSGDPEIVSRLIGRDGQRREEQQRDRVLAFMKEVVPGTSMRGPITIRGGDIRGVWGDIFENSAVEALIAEGMAGEGEGGGDDDAELFLLRWKDGWEIVQKVGPVSAEVSYGGETGWAVRKSGSPADHYVLARTNPNETRNCPSWHYDAASRKLVPTGWPAGLPSVSGDTMTVVSRDMSSPEGLLQRTVYRFVEGKVGPLIGTVRSDFTDEHLLRAAISVPDGSAGKEVTWRIWKMAGGYKPRADVYALGRDEGEKWRGEFRSDAMLEFDWGEGGLGEEGAAEYLWRRLTSTGRDAYFGIWEGKDKRTLREPKSVKVTGLPEAVQRFQSPP